MRSGWVSIWSESREPRDPERQWHEQGPWFHQNTSGQGNMKLKRWWMIQGFLQAQETNRNSKLNLTWQAALTKVSRHSGDDSLRALVFYFYIYIYTQPWWLVAGVDNEKVVESPPKGGDQHLVNKTQPLTWTMTDNYKNTKMVTIKWILLQQEKEDQY